MKSKYPAVEGVLVALALAYFLGYHAWFFVLKTGWTKTREDKYYGINGKGKIARLVFAHLVSTNSKAAILGVQQSRNAMMGASFQASIAALFFNALLDVLLTPSKLQALQNFSLQDPLLERPPPGAVGSTANASNVDIGVASALAVIMLNLVVILVSMMFFVVCVRLYIHAGYYYRAAAHPRRDISAADALRVTLQAQAVYSVGQRMIFFFPITAMWLLGPTVMLVTSVVVTTGVIVLDRWNPHAPERHVGPALAGVDSDTNAQAPAASTAQREARTGGGIAREEAVVLVDNAVAAAGAEHHGASALGGKHSIHSRADGREAAA